MSDTLLDDFSDASPWTAIAPGAARLTLRRVAQGDGNALVLDYDLAGGGFVIARRPLPLRLPEDYVFTLDTRGEGDQHIVEFKLVDDSLANVWRLREENFALTAQWTPWHIGAAEIGYAWGARRTRRPERCDALELAIVGSGVGRLYLRDLRLHDASWRGTPRASASSADAAHAAGNVVRDDDSHWLGAARGDAWLCLDFDEPRAFSAVHIDWLPGALPDGFFVDVLDAEGGWQCRHVADTRPGLRSTVLLPGARSAGLRLRMHAAAQPCGVQHIALEPWYYAPTLFDGLGSMALAAPRGDYPKALLEQQSYWTVSGAPAGAGVPLLNTEGMVEVDDGDFAIEPFVRCGDRFCTWADVTLEASLTDDCLPLPELEWRDPHFTLTIAPVVSDSDADHAVHVRYRLRNENSEPRHCALMLAVRPFIVTPIWQQWQGRGGIATLRHLACDRHGLRVNHARRLEVTPAADRAGVQGFAGGDVVAGLRAGALPTAREVADDDGLASAVLRFDAHLAPGETLVVDCRVPFATGHDRPAPAPLSFDDVRARTLAQWRACLATAPIRLPAAFDGALRTLTTAAAHILVNRQGVRLQPGPRRYTRCYLRDAVGMGSALARLGIVDPLKQLLDWYGPQQRADGELPDCVDDVGPEWLPEYDAYGQYLHGVAEAQRFAPEPAFLERQWPHVQRVLARLEQLRALRTSEAFRDSPCYGLLPESMSHEGYMAQPVHAYWDDFWALRGLHDASWLAGEVGESAEATRISTLAAQFERELERSLTLCIARHGIDFIPGSVELGDFDATAIAIALTVGDAGPCLPRAALEATFERYLAIRRERQGRKDWSNYSAYEIRIVGALVRMGRRDDALEVLNALLADCRPPAWRQWPEQSWRDYDAPAFLGDLPHSWIGAEYIHALLGAFAHERRADASLVLAAGVDCAWLADEGVRITALATHYGPLTYRLWRDAAARVHLEIEGDMRVPPGGFVLRPPLPGPLRAVSVNGAAHGDFDSDQCRCHALPAHIIFECGELPP